MLNIEPRLIRDCEGISRRHMLQVGTLGGLGLSLPALFTPAVQRQQRTKKMSAAF